MPRRPHFLPVRSPQDATHEGYHIQSSCILWLPEKEKIDGDLFDHNALSDGCFNHPVLILSVDPVMKMATILIVSIPIQRILISVNGP
jgi:hypothetical protein